MANDLENMDATGTSVIAMLPPGDWSNHPDLLTSKAVLPSVESESNIMTGKEPVMALLPHQDSDCGSFVCLTPVLSPYLPAHELWSPSDKQNEVVMEEAMEVEPIAPESVDKMDAVRAPPAMLSPVASITGPSLSALDTDSGPSATEPAIAPSEPVFGGPSPIEIAFSFDTTGSMSSCLEELQGNLKNIINRLFMDIPALKISLIAHGDYCDAEHFYVTKQMDFTNDVNSLCEFVNQCGGTGGGDYEECYEFVLKKVREELSWRPGTTKSLVIIGDAIPHPPGQGGNNDHIDWKVELDRLHQELGVRVYSVQCLALFNKQADFFWEELATRSFGKHLLMDQFETIIDLMMAICYKEGGNPALFEAYEREVRARDGPGIRHELDRMFNTLRDGSVLPPTPAPSVSRAPVSKVARVVPLIGKGIAAKRVKSKPAKSRKVPVVSSNVDRIINAVIKNRCGVCRVTNSDNVDKIINDVAKNSLVTRKLRKTPTVQPKKVKSRQILRENVSLGKFALGGLKWSPWVLYRYTSGFTARDTTSHRFRNLFQHHGMKRSVYEVSVQNPNSPKKYVTFFRAANSIPSGVNWDTYILRGLRQQLDHVVDEKCAVYVRRAPMPKTVEFEGHTYKGCLGITHLVRRQYNYAWMRHGRELVKNGVIISQKLS